MSIQVIVQNNNIDLALHQLHHKQYFLQATRWYKKRQGFFEKPSELNRKKRKMKRLVSQRQHFHICFMPIDPLPELSHYILREAPAPLILKIYLNQQFARTSNNALGK